MKHIYSLRLRNRSAYSGQRGESVINNARELSASTAFGLRLCPRVRSVEMKSGEEFTNIGATRSWRAEPPGSVKVRTHLNL